MTTGTSGRLTRFSLGTSPEHPNVPDGQAKRKVKMRKLPEFAAPRAEMRLRLRIPPA